MQYIDFFLCLAVKCQHMEVVLDVIAFSFAALKHATAVVLHALAAGVSALRTIVIQILSTDAATVDPMHSECTPGSSDANSERRDKQKALMGDSTRWLHVVFEMHYQVRSFASPRTLTELEDIVQDLYPHSAIFVAKPSREAVSCAQSDQPAADTAMETSEGAAPLTLPPMPPLLEEPGSSSEVAVSEERVSLQPLSAAEVLGLCAAKWGRPKQPRSDLGKRAKGYFAGRSAPTVPAPVPVAPSSATAESEFHGEQNEQEEREVTADVDTDSAVRGGVADTESVTDHLVEMAGSNDGLIVSSEGIETAYAAKMARIT